MGTKGCKSPKVRCVLRRLPFTVQHASRDQPADEAFYLLTTWKNNFDVCEATDGGRSGKGAGMNPKSKNSVEILQCCLPLLLPCPLTEPLECSAQTCSLVWILPPQNPKILLEDHSALWRRSSHPDQAAATPPSQERGTKPAWPRWDASPGSCPLRESRNCQGRNKCPFPSPSGKTGCILDRWW